MRTCVSALGRLILLTSGLSWAVSVQAVWQEPMILGDQTIIGDVSDPELDEPYPSETPVREDVIEQSRLWLGDYLDRFSGNIDSFFVDTFFSDDITGDDVEGTRARFSFFTRRELGDPVDYKFGLDVKLVLPNTNQRLNLLLESEDESVRESDPLESVENNEYSAALRFIIKESESWKTNLDAGIRWGTPPNPFLQARARRYIYLHNWSINATQKLFYRVLDGVGEETRIQFNRPLTIDQLLRFDAQASYLLEEDYFKLGYSAGYYQELSRKAALGYVASASGSNQHADATFYAYSLAFRYRRQVWREWVFFEVSPELIWTRENDYETTPVIMFRLESVLTR